MGIITHKFDVAISYSSEKRDFAKRIVEKLRPEFKVFFDIDEEHMLTCRQLHEILYTVYYDDADYSIMIITKQYLTSAHPMWEAYTILSRNLFGRNRYFIILDEGVDLNTVCERLFINNHDFRFYKLQELEESEHAFDKFISEVKHRIIATS